MSSVSSTSREAAIAKVRVSLGLSTTPPTEWTYDQRVAYNKALSAEIIRRAADFPPSEVATAKAINAAPTSELEDASFDFGMFGSEMLNNAQELNPVGSLAKSLKWLVPVLAVLAVAFYFAPQIGTAIDNAKRKKRAA